MRRTWIVLALVLVVVAGAYGPRSVSVSAANHTHGVVAKLKCKYGTKTVTEKVHGKKMRVKVCKPMPKPTPTPRPTCPDPEGGACLGIVSGGTYTTTVFQPQITYTVPSGWANYEDNPGNFILVPPGFDAPGVNAGTSDYIFVASSVAAAMGCDPGPAPGVGLTVAAIVQWMTQNPGLVTTTPQNVSIGGLNGVVLDLRMTKTWQQTCPFSNGSPVVPLITGVGRSSFDHVIIPGLAMRLYLLDGPFGVLGIEIDDVRDAGHLQQYSNVVQAMQFKH